MDLSAKLATPDFFPVCLDADRSRLEFLQVSRSALTKAVFLSAKLLQDHGTEIVSENLDDVRVASSNAPARILSPHFIFHVAFCCSTLLARYLEEIGTCLVLKEPDVLANLAALKNERRQQYSALSTVILRLLSRVYPQDRYLVIKPNVPCNEIAFDILRWNQDSRIVAMSVPLDDIVASFLKEKHRVKRLRYWLASMKGPEAIPLSLGTRQLNAMSDAQAIAYWWLWNKRLFEELTKTAPSRVLLLDGNYLAANAGEALDKVESFFGIAPDALLPSADSPLQRSRLKYSKNQLMSFTSSDRERELAALKRRFRGEIAEAEAWSSAPSL